MTLTISFKVNQMAKCDYAIGLHIYGSLLKFNSNIWYNSAHWGDIRLRNLNDPNSDFDQGQARSNMMVPLPPYMASY